MSTTRNRNPFIGLRSFETDEQHLYFGREKQVAEATERLQSNRFLAVIGSSGSGKSSLVRAGVIPTIEQSNVSGNSLWKRLLLRPGDNPLGRLAASMAENLRSVLPPSFHQESTIVEALRRQEYGFITEAVCSSGANILLVVDQFEEIFRFRQSDNENADSDARLFIEALLFFTKTTSFNAAVIITMRSDFLSDCSDYVNLTAILNTGSYLVPRMTMDEFRAAVRKPVESFGATIDTSLVNRIITEAGDDTDVLPILQHAMMRTWDFWRDNDIESKPISEEHYEAVGTIHEALQRHAEEIYGELTTEPDRHIAEKLFKALTNLGDDKRGTRRPTPLYEICALAGAKQEDVVAVINRFRRDGCAFLMPPPSTILDSDTTIDISHESLMRLWGRLKTWVDEEVRSAQLYIGLSATAQSYQQGRTSLLVNPELQIALDWRMRNDINHTWAMRYDGGYERAMLFLDQSEKEFIRETARKELQQKRELKRARGFAFFLGAASVVSVLLTIGALVLKIDADSNAVKALTKESEAKTQQKEAEKQRKEALAQTKISEQHQEIARHQREIAEKEKKNAIEQKQIAQMQKKEAEQRKAEAVHERGIAVEQKQIAEEQKKKAEEQKREADKQREEAVKQKKEADEQRDKATKLRLLSIGRSMAIQASVLAKNPKGDKDLPSLLSYQAYNFTVKNGGSGYDPDVFKALFAVADDKEDKPILRGHTDAVRAVAMQPKGQYCASVGDDGELRFWNPEKPSMTSVRMKPKETGGSDARSVTFSADGRYVAAGFFNGVVNIWDMNNLSQQPVVLMGNTSSVNCLSFDIQGNSIIVGCSDGSLKKWTISSPALPQTLYNFGSKINALDMNKEGSFLVTGSEDGSIRLIPYNRPDDKIFVVQSAGKPVRAVAYTPNGDMFGTADGGGNVRLWKGANGLRHSEFVGHTSGVNSLAFSPTGSMMATASFDRTIRLWDYSKPSQSPVVFDGHDNWVYGVAFDKSGDKIISASADKTVRFWASRPDVLARKICSRTQRKSLSDDEWFKYVGDDVRQEEICQ
jgi:WD40 repeat protein/ABC-type dipeptide/oligopeptide/nickel transport system ATPase component